MDICHAFWNKHTISKPILLNSKTRILQRWGLMSGDRGVYFLEKAFPLSLINISPQVLGVFVIEKVRFYCPEKQVRFLKVLCKVGDLRQKDGIFTNRSTSWITPYDAELNFMAEWDSCCAQCPVKFKTERGGLIL